MTPVKCWSTGQLQNIAVCGMRKPISGIKHSSHSVSAYDTTIIITSLFMLQLLRRTLCAAEAFSTVDI